MYISFVDLVFRTMNYSSELCKISEFNSFHFIYKDTHMATQMSID